MPTVGGLGAGDRRVRSDLPKRLNCSRKLMRLLTVDLRCQDGHNHLGNSVFHHSSEKALRHDEVGVRIGEIPRGRLQRRCCTAEHRNSRSFLRCGHGYGLSLWRLGRLQEAEEIFPRRVLTTRLYVSCLAMSARGRLGMASWDSTLATIEAEDQSADPEGRESDKASYAQAQNTGKRTGMRDGLTFRT